MEKITRPWTEERFGELLKQVPNNQSGAIWPLQRRGMTNSQIAARCNMAESSVPGYRRASDAIYDGVPRVSGDVLRRQLLKLDTLRPVEQDFLDQMSAVTAPAARTPSVKKPVPTAADPRRAARHWEDLACETSGLDWVVGSVQRVRPWFSSTPPTPTRTSSKAFGL